MRVHRNVVSGRDGVGVPCFEAGDPRSSAVLLLHALGGSALTWWREMRWLSEFARVIAIDQRGHGESVIPDEPDWSQAAFVSDIVTAVRACRAAPAVVIAHSMGALNAIRLTAMHPELVRALVLVDTSPRAPRNQAKRKAAMATWPETFASLNEVHEFFGPQGSYVAKSMVQHDDGYRMITPPGRLLAIRADFDERDHWVEYDAIRCPVLIVGGDRSMDPALGAEMARRIPGARYVEIAGAGHYVHYDSPEAFRDAVEPFVRQQLP